MLKIRLFRAGKKNQPFFRIVVTEKKNAPRGGRPLEMLGFLNPLTKEKKINKERVKYWLSVGAQPSATIHNLLVKEGILKAKKKPVHKKSKKKMPEGAAEIALDKVAVLSSESAGAVVTTPESEKTEEISLVSEQVQEQGADSEEKPSAQAPEPLPEATEPAVAKESQSEEKAGQEEEKAGQESVETEEPGEKEVSQKEAAEAVEPEKEEKAEESASAVV